MPALSHQAPTDAALQWFLLPAGQAVLDSEHTAVADALAAHPVVGLPWLWLAPTLAGPADVPVGHQTQTAPDERGWLGGVRCALPLPLASESLGAVVLQHVLGAEPAAVDLIDECARVLVPGGRLAILGLNPHSPFRLRWRGRGLQTRDPSHWRRRLADAGLTPEPTAQGVGPQWSPTASPSLQSGPGLRAAYLQRAEKRTIPMTPMPSPRTRLLPLVDGVPAA